MKPAVASVLVATSATLGDAVYSVSFYHGSRSCAANSRAMSMYGGSIPRDFYKKCRYAETLKPDGSTLYHLAYKLTCVKNATSTGVRLVDYKPGIGMEGCMEAEAQPPKTDKAYAFTLDFATNGTCIGADSPDGDPSGESWMVTFDADACTEDNTIVV
eukprot:TRINITY_DN22437_c0_g1_i1.p1 TRINITY_DN22437_c0_g1~~TRINITY_DN22437_c0_g1_i1.p1  ORF type:complete len:158 (-),score=22.74 TRINITY_DN22437_c0_g1_i1:153-626(-)